MRTLFFLFSALVGLPLAGAGQLIITGVVDGPLSGGSPKAIELFALTDIPDLSIYGDETPTNAESPDGAEFTLSGSAEAGSFIYLSWGTVSLEEVIDIPSENTSAATVSEAWHDTQFVANINGNETVVLYENGEVTDFFGRTGESDPTDWSYEDGYAYRTVTEAPDGTFDVGDWTFGSLEGLTTPEEVENALPFGSFAVPEPHEYAMIGGLGLLIFAAFRRRRGAVA